MSASVAISMCNSLDTKTNDSLILSPPSLPLSLSASASVTVLSSGLLVAERAGRVSLAEHLLPRLWLPGRRAAPAPAPAPLCCCALGTGSGDEMKLA